MLLIPLPFVVSLLLLVMAGILLIRRDERTFRAAYFLIMCAATTAVVGLRWLLDWSVLRTLQPILASGIPVLAWYVFALARDNQRLPWWHCLAPILITFCSVTYNWWSPPLDMMLTGLYVVYGIALWRSAQNQKVMPENVPLSDIPTTAIAIRTGGSMLLFSAVIDGALSLDFMLWDGVHAMTIISMGHAILLPLLSLAVVWVSLHTQIDNRNNTASELPEKETPTTASPSGQPSDNSQEILTCVAAVLTAQQLHLDPNLTLAKLARKSGVPSRLISTAVNQTHQLNISQWVNRYRIEHAQRLLTTSDLPITQIYLESGFQTKSNFHREFSRQVGCTPSAYRKREIQVGADGAL